MLEQEKKLAAEKLMGWDVMKAPHEGMYRTPQMEVNGACRSLGLWNPHKDRNRWPEMFEKMSEEQRRLFIDVLFAQFVSEREAKGKHQCPLGKMYWLFLTVPTDALWKTLAKVLVKI